MKTSLRGKSATAHLDTADRPLFRGPRGSLSQLVVLIWFRAFFRLGEEESTKSHEIALRKPVRFVYFCGSFYLERKSLIYHFSFSIYDSGYEH